MGHILVVDDDPLNRKLLTGSLERDGHRATPAPDGSAALAAIAEDAPDVILLDIEMPRMDGMELLRRIKEDAATRHLPVIMISGVEDTERLVRCLEMGAEDFLPKPVDAAILRARINAGLNRKALHDLERERVRHLFARFFPEGLVDDVLARSEGEPRIEPELLTGTILFADLRGFTAFAEGRPVRDVIGTLNHYHELMSDTILDHRGTLVDYMGDGIMAAFGAPIEADDHADRAIAAAREMVVYQLAAFNAWLQEQGLADGFRMGIGMNSGPVVSGSVGSSRRFEYAVIGDTTNTASRIEAMTKEVPRSILLSEQTKDALRDPRDDLVFVDEVDVRGRQSRIKLWALDLDEATA